MSDEHSQSKAVCLRRAQVREVDRRAIEDYGVPGIVLMENAGRGATEIILSRYLPAHDRSKVTIGIVCGRGNNGGDGFVIARHAANAGAHVEIFLACDPSGLKGDALTNYAICVKMRLPMHPFNSAAEIRANGARLGEAAVIVDAILGTGFSGDVRSPLDMAIEAVNATRMPIVAIDVPSGLDCDTGEQSNATVRAAKTITFVARKTGFRVDSAREFVGEVDVVDIGAPREIVEALLGSG